MASMALSERVRLSESIAATAAGTTDINGYTVDLNDDNGYRSALFTVNFGTITATAVTSIKLQESDDASSWSDLTGTSVTVADDDDDTTFWLDLVKPGKRYARVVVDRGTANAVVDGGLVICYDGNVQPSTHDSTYIGGGEAHVSPVAGTA